MAFQIFHIDDQPEHASWIPGTLKYRLKSFTGFKVELSDEIYGENTLSADLTVKAPNSDQDITVQYCLFYAEEGFVDAVNTAREAGTDIVVIFDLHLGTDTKAGLTLAEQIYGEALNETDNFLFLSGFPNDIKKDLNNTLLNDQVIAKPPNTTELIDRIVDMIKSKVFSNGE